MIAQAGGTLGDAKTSRWRYAIDADKVTRELGYRPLETFETGLARTLDWFLANEAWWRPLHLALAAAFVAGVVIHVVMVTFFAGYVADGGPVTWWHVTAWDF